MRWILLSLLLLNFCAAAADEIVAPKVGTFQGDIIELGFLSDHKGKMLIVDVDPRFVLKIKIVSEATTKARSSLLAIHSPARKMIGSKESAVGQSFQFRFDGKHLDIVAAKRSKK